MLGARRRYAVIYTAYLQQIRGLHILNPVRREVSRNGTLRRLLNCTGPSFGTQIPHVQLRRTAILFQNEGGNTCISSVAMVVTVAPQINMEEFLRV